MSADKAKRAKRTRGKRPQKETPAARQPTRSSGAQGDAPAHDSRTRWIVFAGMAAATIAFFASFVFDGGAMLFGSDMMSQAYQSRAFAVAEVLAGRGLPQWNPFVYGGLPYLSILPYPVYYPTSLLYFVIELHRAIGWAFVLHFLLAGLLGYALARELGLRPGAAAVTGV